jgi:hypothetical protein
MIKDDSENDEDDYINSNTEKQDQLSDEDREYIR